MNPSADIKLSSPATREFWEIPVLFEDAHLLALDKPAGLLTTPDQDNPQLPSLMALLGEWNWWAPAPLRRLHARLGLAG